MKFVANIKKRALVKLAETLDHAFGDHGYFTRDVPVSHSVLIISIYLFLLLVFCLTRI